MTNELDITLPFAVQMWMIQKAEAYSQGTWKWRHCRAEISALLERNELQKQFGDEFENDWWHFDILVGDAKGPEGSIAILFNLLAEALALLSFCPGGVPWDPLFDAATQTMGLFTGWDETEEPLKIGQLPDILYQPLMKARRNAD